MMQIGITFAPFNEDEWTHVNWNPIWRVQADQYAIAQRQPTPQVLAIVHDDVELTALLPLLPNVWAVELGNEPNVSDDNVARDLRLWYFRAIPRLRDTGWGGPIVTAGIANLNSDTLDGARVTIDGLWPDVVFGWHAYDDWHAGTTDLLSMLNGRPHMMTEWGYPMTHRSETDVAGQVAYDLMTFGRLGAIAAIYYQLHDGILGSQDADFGLHAYDGHWRQTETSLVTYAKRSNPG